MTASKNPTYFSRKSIKKNDDYYMTTVLFKDLGLDEQDDIKNLDRVRLHPVEELNHYIIKCIASRVAQRKGYHFMTECKVNQKRIDLLVLDHENHLQMAHEFETTKKKGYEEKSLRQLNHTFIDLKVHYIKDLPKTNKELEDYFKKQIL